jgi:DNA-binding IclR family transcriptional regulator
MIQVLNRAFDILEYLADDPLQPKVLGEIADAVQLNHGTCANILKTMVDRRYVDQTGARKGYCLGINSYRLTDNPSFQTDIMEAARDGMAALTQHLDESSLLAVLNAPNRRLIHRELCDQALQVQTADEKHVYDSASGRLLVAMLSDAELAKFTARHGLPTPELWAGATDQQAFMEQVNRIRADECAFQESTRQVIGYGVPIRRFGNVVASLSVYLPAYRHDSDKAAEVLAALRQTARAINARLAEAPTNQH